jgi:CheY-like chemotaxis protein
MADKSRAPAERRSILVVEDQAIVGLDIATALSRLGFAVQGPVESGEEALERVAADPPDLLLVDIRLAGGLDGIDMVREMRTMLDIPVVYLTAHADSTTLERARQTEPYGYVVKPFDDRDLEAAVEMAFARHGADRRIRHMSLGGAPDASADPRRPGDDAAASRSEFLARMNHELRTPLGAVIGLAELLAASNPPPRDIQTRYALSILDGGRRLLDLINDVLEVASMGFDAEALLVRPCAVGDLLLAAAARVEPFATAQGLELRASVESRLCALQVGVDKDRVAYALGQLLAHVLGAEAESTARIDARYLPASHSVELHVHGLAPDGIVDASVVVTPRPDPAPKRRAAQAGEIGPGVVLARRFIELHGAML